MKNALSSKCTAAAMRLLSRRDHSPFELRAKLAQRGFELSAIDQALNECERLNALNEERFATAVIRNLESRRYGPAYIRCFLESRRVDQQIVDRCLNPEIYPHSAQLESCIALIVKKTGAKAADTGQRKRLFRFLERRGFDRDVIRLALDKTHMTRDVPKKHDFS